MAGCGLSSPTAFSPAVERRLVGLLCGLAAIHVFVFAAAFPFFNNVDERSHFDLVLQYAHGNVPHGLVMQSPETLDYFEQYDSSEYNRRASSFPGGRFPPPPWKRPTGKVATASPDVRSARPSNETPAEEDPWLKIIKATKSWPNYEATEPPLYYALAALWWHVGQWCGFAGGRLLYWIRFLNIGFVAGLVWVGYVAARAAFPQSQFLRIGTPAVLAFLPQTAFYSITNDVLSPLCFGAAFVGLIRWLPAEVPGVRLGAATGLALAAAFLTKLSNLPLLAVSAAAVMLKMGWLARTGRWRPALPSFMTLVLCAGLPAAGWMIWAKLVYGDFTGSTAKIQYLGWTLKPFAEWWHHPLFTLPGLWTFLSGLLQTLWQGEFWWHGRPMDLPWADAFYVVPTLCFAVFAMIQLFRHAATGPQSVALWLAFSCLAASVGFLAFLSIIFNFGNCFYPSPEHPYFDAGRLMLGAVIPFLLFLLSGVSRLLEGIKNKWAWPTVLLGMILFMLATEIATDWTVFSSQYNWFHL